MPLSLNVNGERVDAQVLPRLNLADFLREHLQLTGTHVGCEHGVCGACTVRVNGEIVRSCLMLAVQTEGASVETIEGLSDSGEIADLQARLLKLAPRRRSPAHHGAPPDHPWVLSTSGGVSRASSMRQRTDGSRAS